MSWTTFTKPEENKEHEYRVTIKVACGYLELLMDDEAWNELDKLCAAHQLRAPVIRMRWYLLMKKGLHLAAARIARAGCALHSADASFFLLAAYAYEKHHDLADALGVWEHAPSQIRESAFAHYQSARYSALLGLKEHAREHLHQAIRREPQLTFAADSDAVLSALVHDM